MKPELNKFFINALHRDALIEKPAKWVRLVLNISGMISFFRSDYHVLSGTPLRRCPAAAAFTLVDALVSVLIIGISVGAAISFMASTNSLAEVNRNMNGAGALCQERIAQVVATTFNPPNRVPLYFGTWPVPGTDTVTSTETVQLYTDATGGERVPGTRTTLVSLADASLNLVRVTARVDYIYRGKNYVCQTFTLRAPD